MTQKSHKTSEAAELAVPPVIQIDGKQYKREDLSDEAALLIANIIEARNLLAVREIEVKHFGISVQALESNLRERLEGVPFTELPAKEER